MYKYLIVGDVHCIPSDVNEVANFLNFVADKAREHNVKNVILTGDLHDTHGIVHSEVTWCYYNVFLNNYDLQWILYVGNHDIVLRDRSKHALLSYKSLPNVTVVDNLAHFEHFDIIPYCTEDELLKLVEDAKSHTLLCHHTFSGAQYSNGFYDPNSIDLKKIPYKRVISGHIHLSQTVDNCTYVGSPRWLNAGDANQDKFIWLWNGQEKFEKIPTDSVVKRISRIEITEQNQG